MLRDVLKLRLRIAPPTNPVGAQFPVGNSFRGIRRRDHHFIEFRLANLRLRRGLLATRDILGHIVKDIIADLGSGDGRLCLEAARRGLAATGVELDSALVKDAQATAAAVASSRDGVRLLSVGFDLLSYIETAVSSNAAQRVLAGVASVAS